MQLWYYPDMQVIHTTQVQTDKYEEIKKLQLKALTLEGYYTLPLFIDDESTVSLEDLDGNKHGKLAISSIKASHEGGRVFTQIDFSFIPETNNKCSCGDCGCNC